MEFDENKAIAIVEKYKLSETTLKVWKSRGSIPDKYFDENYITPSLIDKAGAINQDRIISVLNTEIINLNTLAELSNVSIHKINDVKRGKSSFTERELISVKAEINKVRLLVVSQIKSFERIAFTKLLSNSILVINVCIDRDKYLWNRISQIKSKKTDMTKADYEKLKDKFAVVALKLYM